MSIYSIAEMCTCEDALTYILGVLSIDGKMSYNLITTIYLNHITSFHLKAIKQCPNIVETLPNCLGSYRGYRASMYLKNCGRNLTALS